jgi:phosphomevalonate kinase
MSAAVTVALVSGLLEFFKKSNGKEIVFKLSGLSHFIAQNYSGSGFDIAASCYKGIIQYKRYNKNWLINQINNNSIKQIINSEWPELYIKKLNIPKELNLLVGWTGESASTSEMVKKLYEWKKNNQQEYKKLINKISILIEKLIQAWKLEQKEKIINLLEKNHLMLRELGKKSGLNIETDKLRNIFEISNKYNSLGKISGAGGGDSSIIINFNKRNLEQLKNELNKNNIIFLNIEIDK